MSHHQSLFAKFTFMSREVDLVQPVLAYCRVAWGYAGIGEAQAALASRRLGLDQGHHDEQDLYEHRLTGARYQFAVLSAPHLTIRLAC